MSRIEDWMEMEEAVSPERLEQMAASECPPLTNDEQQRIKQSALQKIVQLQDAQITEKYALAAQIAGRQRRIAERHHYSARWNHHLIRQYHYLAGRHGIAVERCGGLAGWRD